MKAKKKITEEAINVRVWKKSWLKLRVLAAKRGINLSEAFDELVSHA